MYAVENTSECTLPFRGGLQVQRLHGPIFLHNSGIAPAI